MVGCLIPVMVIPSSTFEFSHRRHPAILREKDPGGGGGDSHMKQTGMLVVSLRVLRAKRQYFKPPRCRLRFREETQNYVKRNRSHILHFKTTLYN